MKIDLLVAEIGSTTTVVNAFTNLSKPCPIFLGQGLAPTSVLEGDVNIGLKNAVKSLKDHLKVKELEYDEFYATSSAAGGLKMTVHGLVYDMTVKAAKEAALGAGANVHLITAGKLRNSYTKKINEIKPNIILLAGGVDYGERDTALYNAEKIARMNLNTPVIYAGNIENKEDIIEIFEDSDCELYIVDNVYPRIDELNIEPTRKIIQQVFEKHITKAPGMGKIRDVVNGNIVTTPGAVMLATILLKDKLGDLMTIDVGGATTDVHSVTDGSEEINSILISPEPTAKRTVEGDLGVYLNINNIIDLTGGIESFSKQLGWDKQLLIDVIKKHKAIPVDKNDITFTEYLTKVAVHTGVKRHCGTLKYFYGASGKKALAEGKDLTSIKYIIGTGGALTRLPNGKEILKSMAYINNELKLLPSGDAEILIDKDYIMASLGVMSLKHERAAKYLLKKSLNIIN